MADDASIAALLAHAIAHLSGSSPTPRPDAEALLLHVSAARRADLIAHGARTVDSATRLRYAELVERRRNGDPVAYLTGHREFWSLDIRVSPATLIPRTETELLVERALALLPPDRAARVVELGTGSGAIALAIASERPRARIAATDVSSEALAIARANADRLGLRHIEFRQGSWLEPLAGERFDLIVSNPPYVALDDRHLLEGDLRFEPRHALVAGRDGLDAVRHIVLHASGHLEPDAVLLLEHGHDQGGAVCALLGESGYSHVTTHTDLAGLPRVTQARRP